MGIRGSCRRRFAMDRPRRTGVGPQWATAAPDTQREASRGPVARATPRTNRLRLMNRTGMMHAARLFRLLRHFRLSDGAGLAHTTGLLRVPRLLRLSHRAGLADAARLFRLLRLVHRPRLMHRPRCRERLGGKHRNRHEPSTNSPFPTALTHLHGTHLPTDYCGERYCRGGTPSTRFFVAERVLCAAADRSGGPPHQSARASTTPPLSTSRRSLRSASVSGGPAVIVADTQASRLDLRLDKSVSRPLPWQ